MIHAIDRARERYGLDLTCFDLMGFVDQIRAGTAKKLEKGRKGVTKYLVNYRGRKLPVAYHRKEHIILSVLPPESAEVRRVATRWVAF